MVFFKFNLARNTKMRRFNTRGVVAMEADEDKNEEVSETTAPASVDAAEAEAAVVDSAVEGDENDESIEEAKDVSETLEVAAESLRIAAANGGIDKYSARAIGALTQHLYNRVGLKARAMPALESFGGTSTRIGATQLALEGIKSGVKEIWKSIIAAIKRMVAWVKGHFLKVFGGAEKMVKRANAIKDAADAASGKKQKERSFENSEIVKKLYIGNSVTPDAVTSGLAVIDTLIKDILGTKASAMIDGGKKLIEAIENPTGMAAYTIPANSNKPTTASVSGSDKYGVSSDDMPVFTTGELLGGTVYAVRTNKALLTGDAAIQAFGEFKAKFVSKADSKVPSSEKVNTLTINQIDNIASKVISIGEELISFRSTGTKLDKLLEDATKAAESAAKNEDNEVATESRREGRSSGRRNISTEDTPPEPPVPSVPPSGGEKSDRDKEVEIKAHGALIRKAISNLPKYIVTVFASATTYPLTTGQAALSYCEKSLSNYE